jgi:formylglycine-generating enzyme
MRTFLLPIAVAASAYAQQSFDLGGGVKLDMIRVEPGTFMQGSPANEAGRGADETQRNVTLTKPFLIGKYPVTRGQFARFAASGYRTEAEKGTSGGFGWEGGKLVQKKQYTWRAPGFPQTDEHPVVIVDFNDAQEFCAWLSRTTGRRFTLPTEAQWEYAARAGAKDAWHGADAERTAWHRANSPGGTQPVGGKLANAWGIHDMPGNVWEWCADWYAPYPPGDARDPLQTNANLSDKPRRVLRGGAFSRPAEETRAAKRFRNDPGSRNADNGFRVVTFDVASPVTPPPAARPVRQPEPAPALERSEPVPATLPDVERVHHEREPEQGSGSGMKIVLILAGVGLAFVLLLRKVLRAAPLQAVSGGVAPQSGGARHGAPLRVKTTADGFWVSGQIPRGTPLRARWSAGGAQQQREFGYEPGPDGQFVFTGGQPISVSVMVATDSLPDTGTAMGMMGEMLDRDHTPTPTPRPSRFRGHPPAY